MGLIMLILIGTVPTAYALNRAHAGQPDGGVPGDVGGRRRRSFEQQGGGLQRASAIRAPAVTAYVSRRKINEGTYPSLPC